MLSLLRAELQALLAELETTRKPFLRRSLRPDALFTTDLPRCASAAVVETFLSRAAAQGLRAQRMRDVIEVDCTLAQETARPLPPPRAATLPLHALCHLLARHATGETDAALLRRLAKAEEAGARELDRFAKECHALCAARLREHAPLPGGLLGPMTRMLAEKESVK